MNFTNVIFILLIIIILLLLYWNYYLNKKIDKFLLGSSSQNLDESIVYINSLLKDTENFKKEMQDYLLTVEKRLKKSIQTVKTIRFNPFKGTGSGNNQSFSTTFLNEERDGVIISSLYSREHLSIYSKPVKKGTSEYELSGEEKESLDQAKNSLTK